MHKINQYERIKKFEWNLQNIDPPKGLLHSSFVHKSPPSENNSNVQQEVNRYNCDVFSPRNTMKWSNERKQVLDTWQQYGLISKTSCWMMTTTHPVVPSMWILSKKRREVSFVGLFFSRLPVCFTTEVSDVLKNVEVGCLNIQFYQHRLEQVQ